MRHSGKLRFPAIFLRPLSGSAAAPPAPLAPRSAGLGLGGCGLPKVTASAPRRLGPILPARPRPAPCPPQLLEGRSPRTAGLGPGIPPRAPAPPVTAGVPLPRRPRSPPAQSRPGPALTAAGTRCLRPPAPGRPMSERGCRGDATRPWLLGRNSAASLPPAGPPLLAGAGTVTALSAPRGRLGPRGCGAAPPLSCGPCGARQRWGGRGTQTPHAVEPPRSWGGSGDGVGGGRRGDLAQQHPAALESAPGYLPLPAVPCRPPRAAALPELAPRLGSRRFVTVARALRAGSGSCRYL